MSPPSSSVLFSFFPPFLLSTGTEGLRLSRAGARDPPEPSRLRAALLLELLRALRAVGSLFFCAQDGSEGRAAPLEGVLTGRLAEGRRPCAVGGAQTSGSCSGFSVLSGALLLGWCRDVEGSGRSSRDAGLPESCCTGLPGGS